QQHYTQLPCCAECAPPSPMRCKFLLFFGSAPADALASSSSGRSRAGMRPGAYGEGVPMGPQARWERCPLNAYKPFKPRPGGMPGWFLAAVVILAGLVIAACGSPTGQGTPRAAGHVSPAATPAPAADPPAGEGEAAPPVDGDTPPTETEGPGAPPPPRPPPPHAPGPAPHLHPPPTRLTDSTSHPT